MTRLAKPRQALLGGRGGPGISSYYTILVYCSILKIMKKNNALITLAVVIFIIILGGLFYYPNIGKESVVTDVPCLIAKVPLRQHLHPVLKIFVGDAQEIVPANIGLGGSCERALHTHDDGGTIHVEAQDARNYVLGDFFGVWGKSLQRTGYSLEVKVGGSIYADDPTKILFKDKQEIELRYKLGPVNNP